MAERKRFLNDLRVIDLRAELEKRNLDKSGVRGVLIQRLSKHLEEEGHDPATFTFELGSEVKTPSKRTRRSESTVEPESEEAPAMEDMIVQDDAGEEEESEHVDSQAKEQKPFDNDNSEDKMEVDDKISRKRESKEESEASQPKKPCIEKEEKSEDDPKAENNTDADDSINLDLGEDELLNEETDNTEKNDNKGSVNLEENFGHMNYTEYKRQGRPLSSSGERPVLTQLIITTDVDDAVLEDSAETAGDDSAQADEAAPTDAAPDDDQQEVKAEAPAISNEGETIDKDQKDDKDKESEGDKKEKKDDSKEGGARNLWVSGLSGDTRAKDLKQLCSKHGKVIGAKVVTNAKTPGSRCYGYVTMASPQDAENCIKNLHRTELHGRMISVEKAKSESESASRRQPSRAERRPSKERKDDLKDEEGKEGAEKTSESKPKKEGELSGEESTRSTSRTREKSQKSDKDKTRRSTRSRERKRSPNREVLSFSKIWKERDVARARERSRAAREEERRRRAAEDALRERERRQRQEKHRLAVEREKLRAEREKIEREKNELLRLERERHRLEREKLELERLELKRAQLRLEEERRKRGYEGGAAYRKPAASPPPEPAYERDARHKRPAPQAMSTSRGQFEAPPPPRFELPSGYERAADKRERDYKRDYRHVSSGNMKYPSNGSSNDDSRQAIAPGARPKEPGRSYESREARAYRPSPPGKPEARWSSSSRYPDTATASKGSGEGWSASEARYSAAYEARYPPQYQPPPPGVSYPERYAPPAGRDYPRKY